MSVDRFYLLEQEKLLIEFEKIALFTDHGPTLGTYRENLLHDYIRKFTPNAISVGQGFVMKHIDAKQGEISSASTRQVDCLIYDEHDRPTFLKTKDFAVISAEAIRGAIEIKSNLSFYKTVKRGEEKFKVDDDYPLGGDYTEAYRWEGTLIDAFKNIKSVANVTGFELPYFSGIFSYGMNFSTKTLYHAFDNNEIQRQLGIQHIRELPLYICSLSGTIILLTDTPWSAPDAADPYFSHFVEIQPASDSKDSFALQLFTVGYIQQMGFFQKRFNPITSGLFSVAPKTIKMFEHHFDLYSGSELK